MEQIQFLLGHVSVQTTEKYLGCKQRFRHAVNDRLGIEPATCPQANTFLIAPPKQTSPHEPTSIAVEIGRPRSACKMKLSGTMSTEDSLKEGEDKERPCQAVAANDQVCGFPATVRYTMCTKWFCDAHAEDEQWHPCVSSPGFN